MRGLIKFGTLATYAIVIFASSPLLAQVASDNPTALQKIGVDEHLGDKVPLDLAMRDDSGKAVMLQQYFRDGKPVVLTLFYSDCPMLCSLVLTSLQKATSEMDFRPGVDYRLVSVSIDPKETPDKSKNGHDRFTANFPEGSLYDAWSFHTADDSTITRLTQAVGFRYFYDEKQKSYAHPAVIFVLMADGTISRYIYGIDYKPRDLRLALLEASEGKIGTTVDRILLYCYHYDPQAGGYVLMASRLMKLGGVVTVIGLGLLLAALRGIERKKEVQ